LLNGEAFELAVCQEKLRDRDKQTRWNSNLQERERENSISLEPSPRNLVACANFFKKYQDNQNETPAASERQCGDPKERGRGGQETLVQ
jgi:hypothetical protein